MSCAGQRIPGSFPLACAAVSETSAHVYLRCPKYSAPRPALLAAVAAWCDDVEAGGRPPWPSAGGASRWVHEDRGHRPYRRLPAARPCVLRKRPASGGVRPLESGHQTETCEPVARLPRASPSVCALCTSSPPFPPDSPGAMYVGPLPPGPSPTKWALRRPRCLPPQIACSPKKERIRCAARVKNLSKQKKKSFAYTNSNFIYSANALNHVKRAPRAAYRRQYARDRQSKKSP